MAILNVGLKEHSSELIRETVFLYLSVKMQTCLFQENTLLTNSNSTSWIYLIDIVMYM